MAALHRNGYETVLHLFANYSCQDVDEVCVKNKSRRIVSLVFAAVGMGREGGGGGGGVETTYKV